MTNLDLNVENLPNKKISDNQAGHDDSAMSIYNEKELKYLDKYLPTVKNAFDVSKLLIDLNRRMSCIRSY